MVVETAKIRVKGSSFSFRARNHDLRRWRFVGDSNSWPPPWQGGVLRYWTNEPYERCWTAILNKHNTSAGAHIKAPTTVYSQKTVAKQSDSLVSSSTPRFFYYEVLGNLNGCQTGTWTPNPRVNSATLYRLSYLASMGSFLPQPYIYIISKFPRKFKLFFSNNFR